MTHLPPQRSSRSSRRFILETVIVLAAGLAGGASVYAGEAYQWPGFNVRAGYWGTDFMSDYLYAVGSDVTVKVIVAWCWAQDTTLSALSVVGLMRLLFPGRRLPSRSH